MIALFEREFIESQEALGMRLVGQFRDRNDPTRFTWIREFPNMPERERALNVFYFGPVWARHREAANATLEDNDNVLCFGNNLVLRYRDLQRFLVVLPL